MAKTVTVWLRLNENTSLGASLLAGESASARSLIIRLHPSPTGGEDTEDFYLPYNPISVQYGDLSDEIAQIPRPGTTPIVTFKSHRLMTVNMTFTLAKPGDGLVTSIENDLQALRRFAASSNRLVSLLNFDELLTQPQAYRNMSAEANAEGLFFSIVEFSFESTRRNTLNQITQANCQLSLIENRNPYQNISYIPILKKVRPPKNCKNKKWARRHPEICFPEKINKKGLPLSVIQDHLAALGIDWVKNQKAAQAAIDALARRND
jgi:hypothetical protein